VQLVARATHRVFVLGAMVRSLFDLTMQVDPEHQVIIAWMLL
jgi:hypothetical protein